MIEDFLSDINPDVKYLFHNQVTKQKVTTMFIDSLFLRTKKDLVFNKLGPHLLRHTFCTTLAKSNNVDIKTISTLMGHKSLNMTLRYIHLVNQEELAITSITNNPISNL